MPTFKIYKDLSMKYRYRLLADDGTVLLNGVGHSLKERVQKDIASVRRHAKNPLHYVEKNDREGYFFTMVRHNGDAIGRSEVFKTKEERNEGVERVRELVRHAPRSAI